MSEPTRPPRDQLVRALFPGPAVRHADDSEEPPTLFGHFAVFNEWTEVDSLWEGQFMERIAPGAFAKTFKERGDQVKVTFNHGHDPTMGDLVLGPIRSLTEDEEGAAYEVELLDSVPAMLREGLEKGVYGSSFRFRVMREEFNQDVESSKVNPKGLPERTIKEVELYEFGPVTFPAYANATAGVRSMTDEDIFERISKAEGLRRFYNFIKARDPEEPPAPSDPTPAEATSDAERRASVTTIPRHSEWMRQRQARK